MWLCLTRHKQACVQGWAHHNMNIYYTQGFRTQFVANFTCSFPADPAEDFQFDARLFAMTEMASQVLMIRPGFVQESRFKEYRTITQKALKLLSTDVKAEVENVRHMMCVKVRSSCVSFVGDGMVCRDRKEVCGLIRVPVSFPV